MSPAKLCLALALMLQPVCLSAQLDSSNARAGSPALRVMHRLRTEGVSGQALFVLRGFRGNWTRAEQDEVADSLAAFLIARRETDGMQSLLSAHQALSSSSYAEGYGTRYVGAGERFRRIAESGGPGARGAAMSAIGQLPDSTESLQILERLARFPGRAAEMAVQKLADSYGNRGLDALRKLHTEGSAGTPEARRTVASVACSLGWVNPN